MSRLARNGVALALCCSLAGCASFPLFGQRNAPAAPPAAPVAVSCPGGLSAEVQPQPKVPDGAAFPQPVSDEEKSATAIYLGWLGEVAAWGRAGWLRASDAKRYCAGAAAGPAKPQ